MSDAIPTAVHAVDDEHETPVRTVDPEWFGIGVL
jgi:hypothetical protein